jgi:hypothetical protein
VYSRMLYRRCLTVTMQHRTQRAALKRAVFALSAHIATPPPAKFVRCYGVQRTPPPSIRFAGGLSRKCRGPLYAGHGSCALNEGNEAQSVRADSRGHLRCDSLNSAWRTTMSHELYGFAFIGCAFRLCIPLGGVSGQLPERIDTRNMHGRRLARHGRQTHPGKACPDSCQPASPHRHPLEPDQFAAENG